MLEPEIGSNYKTKSSLCIKCPPNGPQIMTASKTTQASIGFSECYLSAWLYSMHIPTDTQESSQQDPLKTKLKPLFYKGRT